MYKLEISGGYIDSSSLVYQAGLVSVAPDDSLAINLTFYKYRAKI